MIPEANLTALPALCGHLSAALNDFEIVILGGHQYDEPNVQLYDSRTDSCSSVVVDGTFNFTNYGGSNYPIAQCGYNTVVALVRNDTDEPCFIKYEKETDAITVLQFEKETDAFIVLEDFGAA